MSVKREIKEFLKKRRFIRNGALGQESGQVGKESGLVEDWCQGEVK